MKSKVFIISILILGCFHSKASHVVGGMISVHQYAYNSVQVEMKLVTGTGNTPQTNVLIERWSDDGTGNYSFVKYDTLANSGLLQHQGYWVLDYTSNNLDLDSNKYRFIYTHCCWLNANVVGLSSDFIISADYWHLPNHSLPRFLHPLWLNMQKDIRNTMKPMFGQVNCFFTGDFTNTGDSIFLTQGPVIGGYSNNMFVPKNHHVLNMVVNNDSISWLPDTVNGFAVNVNYDYATGFELQQYRNQVLIGTQRIQWSFIIKNSTVGINEENISPEIIEIWDWQGRLLQKDFKELSRDQLYIIKYSDGSVRKVFLGAF
ncbi:MAG: hypothetical protein ACPG89_01930 [Schleiferiaceae bacterium]|jgi:hypothetical protein